MQRAISIVVIALGLCVTGDSRAADSTPDSVVRGRQTFIRVGCYLCHGYEAQGGAAGARLAPGPIPLEAIVAFTRGTRGEMPAFSEKVLSNAELADIYAFLASVPPAKSPDTIPALNNLK